MLVPAAAGVDQGQVPRSHLDALAATGVFGAGVNPAVPAAAFRAAQEAMAAACLATWFVQVQHHSPARLVASGPDEVRAQLLPLLASGAVIAGISFAHLRRWPDRPVHAERVPGGWRLTGRAPWYTGWDLNDVAVVAGATADGQAVFGLVPAQAGHGLRAEPLDAPVVLAGTRTVALALDGTVVGDDGVLAVQPIEQWRQADAARAANVNPAVFGVTAAAVALLREAGAQAETAATRVAERSASLRARADALLDGVAPTEGISERLAVRTEALRLCVETTSAAVAARGGGALSRSDPAQRHAREALFLLVQGQTAAARSALLEAAGR